MATSRKSTGLEALGDMTGLASTYLTVVHTDDELQKIRYARNTRDDFELPEGMFVPWEDTLCKRARDEDRPCTTDVPAVRGDHDAARSLGLQVYISVPVETPDGKLWGTLCAADSSTVDDVEAHDLVARSVVTSSSWRCRTTTAAGTWSRWLTRRCTA